MATIYDKFTAIANSIREKTGKTELLTLDDMAYEISTISGGLELNFNIKRYSSEEELLADTPSENTIGIISDIEITGYQFSAIEPEDMVDGMVWIKTDNSSYIAFDIVDGVTVYPISAKQYVSGALVDKTAKIYRNGEWVIWWNGELYDRGDQFESATGGWKYVDDDGYKGRTRFNSANISINNKSSYETDTIYTNNMMDLTDFSKITAVVEVSGVNIGVYVGIASRNNNHRAYENCSLAHKKTTKSGTITCDIPSTVNSGYPYVCADEANVTITKIYLE